MFFGDSIMLTEESKLYCSWGGKIGIIDTGTKTAKTGARGVGGEEQRKSRAVSKPKNVDELKQADKKRKAVIKKEDNKSDKDETGKMYYLGADGKRHYLDPKRLYQCQKIAYNNKAFDRNPVTKQTYCNRYAESVLRQYTGIIEFADKNCANIYLVISKSPKLKKCDAKTAQELANKGYFAVAISTRTATPNAPEKLGRIEHIATIAPGEGVEKGKQKFYCPAIAQQGATKILYNSETDKNKGTLNYAWRSEMFEFITFWYKVPDGEN